MFKSLLITFSKWPSNSFGNIIVEIGKWLYLMNHFSNNSLGVMWEVDIPFYNSFMNCNCSLSNLVYIIPVGVWIYWFWNTCHISYFTSNWCVVHLCQGILPDRKPLKDSDAWVIALSKTLSPWWTWVGQTWDSLDFLQIKRCCWPLLCFAGCWREFSFSWSQRVYCFSAFIQLKLLVVIYDTWKFYSLPSTPILFFF